MMAFPRGSEQDKLCEDAAFRLPLKAEEAVARCSRDKSGARQSEDCYSKAVQGRSSEEELAGWRRVCREEWVKKERAGSFISGT